MFSQIKFHLCLTTQYRRQLLADADQSFGSLAEIVYQSGEPARTYQPCSVNGRKFTEEHHETQFFCIAKNSQAFSCLIAAEK